MTDQVCQSQRLERLAEWIESKGLCAPAILFLEVGKPLAFVAGQLLLFTQPLIGSVMSLLGRENGDRALEDYVLLLESSNSLDWLVERLEHAVPSAAE